MSFIQKIVQSVLPVGRRFRTYEHIILASLEAALEPRGRMALRYQLEHVSRIQRHVTNKEINMYYDAHLACSDQVFQCDFAEYPIALLWCSVPECSNLVRASVWIVGGRLFSIVLSRSPGRDWDVGFNVIRTLILCDPSTERVELPTEVVELGSLAQYVGEHLQRRIERRSVLCPLPEPLRERFLLPASDCVPLDYYHMLSITNGYQLENWRILGLPLREVAMEGSNLFVLAESSDSKVLCATDGDTTRALQLVDLEDHSQRELRSQLKAALETLLS
jgi:hypothetical protein